MGRSTHVGRASAAQLSFSSSRSASSLRELGVRRTHSQRLALRQPPQAQMTYAPRFSLTDATHQMTRKPHCRCWTAGWRYRRGATEPDTSELRPLRPRNHDDPPTRHGVTYAVVGMLLVPLVSVSTAVLAGDVVTAADDASLSKALIATLLGAITGAWSRHILRRLLDAVACFSRALVDRSRTAGLPLELGSTGRFRPHVVLVPVDAVWGSSLRRRGPPVGLV